MYYFPRVSVKATLTLERCSAVFSGYGLSTSEGSGTSETSAGGDGFDLPPPDPVLLLPCESISVLGHRGNQLDWNTIHRYQPKDRLLAHLKRTAIIPETFPQSPVERHC